MTLYLREFGFLAETEHLIDQTINNNSNNNSQYSAKNFQKCALRHTQVSLIKIVIIYLFMHLCVIWYLIIKLDLKNNNYIIIFHVGISTKFNELKFWFWKRRNAFFALKCSDCQFKKFFFPEEGVSFQNHWSWVSQFFISLVRGAI